MNTAVIPILNTGSCGIHIVHGAFKNGCEAAGGLIRKPCQVVIGYVI